MGCEERLLKSLVNFRDLGGKMAADGRMVQPRRLLRSGEIVGVEEGDIQALRYEYMLRHIVDLRSAEEVRRAPDQPIDGAEYHNILLHRPREVRPAAPEEKEFRKLHDPKQVEAFMVGVYEQLITDHFALRGFSNFLRLVRDNEEGAVIFHCFAGKDRTGIAAAMLYAVLGVGKEGIMEDYLLTNELRREKNNELLEKAREEGKTENHLKALAVSYEVRPSYLQKVFEVTEQKDGTFLEYIKRNMNISDDDTAKIRHNYLK